MRAALANYNSLKDSLKNPAALIRHIVINNRFKVPGILAQAVMAMIAFGLFYWAFFYSISLMLTTTHLGQ